MRSSRTPRAWVLGGLLCALGARAQTPVEGFNAERFYPSAPGAGWFVMDSLDMHGELGGALAFSARYAQRAAASRADSAVVTDSAYGQVAGAFTWHSWRFSVGFDFPFAVKGRSGTMGGYQYTAPDVDLGSQPGHASPTSGSGSTPGCSGTRRRPVPPGSGRAAVDPERARGGLRHRRHVPRDGAPAVRRRRGRVHLRRPRGGAHPPAGRRRSARSTARERAALRRRRPG